ncbi:hypothetical protein MtrunA17_Chr2g0284971 [Medicago truncatula]|uniref:Uncharacterized protein n=1 Tax=Medicago truncatula TaxID=3880 RepID=A0A396J6D3_MEDTR|nr:hypothetical protein MtrunA17_Chr2g0284971 [Medicago truncatula]
MIPITLFRCWSPKLPTFDHLSDNHRAYLNLFLTHFMVSTLLLKKEYKVAPLIWLRLYMTLEQENMC